MCRALTQVIKDGNDTCKSLSLKEKPAMEGLINTKTRHEETWFPFKLLRHFKSSVNFTED